MHRSITIAHAICAVLVVGASTSRAVIIDTFSDGTIVNSAVPPTQYVNQSGLSGVIGAGDRNLEWSAGVSDPAWLDLNHSSPGSVVMTAGPTSLAFWAIGTGVPTAYDVDFTDGGLSTGFAVQFASGNAGDLSIEMTDTSSNFDRQTISFLSLPSGGLVAMPFSLFSGLIDFHHIANATFEIDSVMGGAYEIQEWRTAYVPEPGSSTLLAIASAILCATWGWRRVDVRL